MKKWHAHPEILILSLGLVLELIWEIIQFPLFTIWHEESWSNILFALVHCTLGDLMILLAAYWIVALLNRNRHWYQINVFRNALLFTIIGLTYTVYSENINVSIRGSWEYNELMPIIPFIGTGAAPFLQWLLIPPVLLWLMRRVTDSRDLISQ